MLPANHPSPRKNLTMQFSGTKQFPQPLDQVWPRISDACFLVDSLKNVDAVTLRQPDHAEWKSRPGLSFVAGTLDTRLQILERVKPTMLRLLLTSKGIGSSSSVEVQMSLVEHEGGTRIDWQAEIKTLTGLLKMVPKGLIQSAAQKSIEDVWNGVAEKIRGEFSSEK